MIRSIQDDFAATDYESLSERLGSNDRLWFLALIIIIGLSVALIFISRPSEKRNNLLKESPIGTYTDSSHREFAASVEKVARTRGIPAKAVFLSDRTFRIIVPGDISTDEISFLCRFSVMGIYKKFGVKVKVLAYTESVSSTAPKLTAEAVWLKENEHFIIRQVRTAGSE